MWLGLRVIAFCSIFAQSSGFFGGWNTSNGCYILLAQKLRHRDFMVSKKMSVGSLYECKKQCDMTFINCKSFSYNTNLDGRFTNNCLLSMREPQSLDLREGADLTFDRDFVFYGKFSELRCQSAYDSLKGSSGRDYGSPTGGSVSRCFRLVRRGGKIDIRYIRQTLSVLTVTECELGCLRAAFVCRGFNYKSDRILHASSNCELSGQDSYRVNIDDGSMFHDQYDFDFYERTSFSNDCGLQSSVSTFGRETDWRIPTINNNFGGYGIGSRIPSANDCFSLKKKYTRPDMRFILEKDSASSLDDCKRRCREHRSCKSFAFRPDKSRIQWHTQNCYLCDFHVGIMNRPYDLVADQEFDLYQKDDRSGYCQNFRQSRSNPYAREGGFQTVSGYPCAHDRCREDANGKYYFCDTDNTGSWDYCCRPDEVCRTHKTADIAWCHVGSQKKDQWRPCKATGIGRSFLMEVATYPNRSLLAYPSISTAHSYKGAHPIELREWNSLI